MKQVTARMKSLVGNAGCENSSGDVRSAFAIAIGGWSSDNGSSGLRRAVRLRAVKRKNQRVINTAECKVLFQMPYHRRRLSCKLSYRNDSMRTQMNASNWRTTKKKKALH